jgi:hypothetical protein
MIAATSSGGLGVVVLGIEDGIRIQSVERWFVPDRPVFGRCRNTLMVIGLYEFRDITSFNSFLASSSVLISSAVQTTMGGLGSTYSAPFNGFLTTIDELGLKLYNSTTRE